jgi:hypothetical protein|tara:strand:- start:154 stop:330 length:177 start_codon:yes stop_codon:yes gene_type:complete
MDVLGKCRMLAGCRCLEVSCQIIELLHEVGELLSQLLVLLVLEREQGSQYRNALVHPS